MRKYYIHDGTNQQGPFDFDELKGKNIHRGTSIWYEGISEWTTAGKIEELKELFKVSTPPPFKKLEKKSVEVESNENRRTIIIVAVIVSLIITIGLILISSSSNSSVSYGDDSYEEKVMTVEEIERSQPTAFLTAEGNYNENLWGTKINVHGKIRNTATVASYKDAVVRVTYYSKTKTELGSDDYTIYEVFEPHSTTNFELRIENYKNVETIGWEVIRAEAN